MASTNVLTMCFASTLVSNNRALLLSPLPKGFGPRSSSLTQTPLIKGPCSGPCGGLVVRAKQGGCSPRRMESNPMLSEQFNRNGALLETTTTPSCGKYTTPSTASLSYIVRTTWNTTEDEHKIRMWFDMPGIECENIQVDVVDDLLVIRGDNGLDTFGNPPISPSDSKIQIPHNSRKEEITAEFRNGVLYISVPKIMKCEQNIIHIPVRSA